MSSLGRFTILRELGRGGMGVVFLAHDPDMARDVAIKVLCNDSALSDSERDEIARRFDREAQAGGGLTHPNIVAHYERGQTGNWTADRYDEDYYRRGSPRDPQGPDAGDFRVLRGGSWIRDPSEIRVSLRYPLLPGNPDQGIGFRCVADQLP